MIPSYPTTLPPQNTAIVDPSGNLTNVGMSFMRALLNRTGMGTGIPLLVGTTPADGSELAFDINEINPSVTATVALFSGMLPGMQQWVWNGTGVTIGVLPFAGAQIDVLGLGVGYPLADLKTQIFTCYSLTQIRSLQLG